MILSNYFLENSPTRCGRHAPVTLILSYFIFEWIGYCFDILKSMYNWLRVLLVNHKLRVISIHSTYIILVIEPLIQNLQERFSMQWQRSITHSTSTHWECDWRQSSNWKKTFVTHFWISLLWVSKWLNTMFLKEEMELSHGDASDKPLDQVCRYRDIHLKLYMIFCYRKLNQLQKKERRRTRKMLNDIGGTFWQW